MNQSFFNKKILSPLEEWTHLGEIKNDMGTRLIGHVPHIAPKAYVHVVYSPLKDEDLLEFGERLERPIPIQYEEFLGYANGLMVFSGALRVMGYTPIKRKADVHVYNYPPNVIVSNVSARMKGLSHGAVIVGFYKEDGSYASIEEDGSVVRFDAKGSGDVIQKWSDFDIWLSSEIAILNKDYKAAV